MSEPKDTPADRWIAFAQMVDAVHEAFRDVDRAGNSVRQIEYELDRVSVGDRHGGRPTPAAVKLLTETRNAAVLAMVREAEIEREAAVLIAKNRLECLRSALSSHLGGALVDLGERIRGLK